MMIRPFTLFCAIIASVSGMVLYTQKHKTTLLDRQIAKIVVNTQKIKSQTAMLRTEWTLLNQPDRLKTLSGQFAPQLRPLQPSQFVQLASAAQFLPPPQIENKPDKTREEIGKSVAKNHGQDFIVTEPDQQKQPPSSAIAQQQSKSPPTIISPATTTKTVAAEVSDDKDTVITPTKNIEKPVSKPKHNIETAAIKPEEKQTKPDIKVASSKPKHHDMVTYNIQESNTFSRSKAENVKPSKTNKSNDKDNSSKVIANATGDSTSDTVAAYSPKKVTPKKPVKTPKNNNQNQNPIKMVRYETKQTSHKSESVLENNPSDALPPPVPFSR